MTYPGNNIYSTTNPLWLVAKQTLTLSECPRCSQECPNRPFASFKLLFIIVTSEHYCFRGGGTFLVSCMAICLYPLTNSTKRESSRDNNFVRRLLIEWRVSYNVCRFWFLLYLLVLELDCNLCSVYLCIFGVACTWIQCCVESAYRAPLCFAFRMRKLIQFRDLEVHLKSIVSHTNKIEVFSSLFSHRQSYPHFSIE